MYYNTIINNRRNGDKQVTSKDFVTCEQWESYKEVMRAMQDAMADWRENDDSADDKYFKALNGVYGFINSLDGIPNEKQYVPQDITIEVKRYSFLSAKGGSKWVDTDESKAYFEEYMRPISDALLDAILLKMPKDKKDALAAEYKKHGEKHKALMRKEGDIRAYSETAFRKGFEKALAMAIEGGKMLTREQRKADQKAKREDAKAKKQQRAIELGIAKA